MNVPHTAPSTNVAPSATTPSSSPSMAMDLGQVQVRHISTEEKRRRQEQGLCNYCGEGKHFARDCPKKKHLASAEIGQDSFIPDEITFSLGKDEA
ncbi:hypothetical protein FBU30_002384, partial [Linnemannia zychae]